MTTLDRLRALHQEVCFAWRRYSDPSISEGEAEILNLGFIVLEKCVEAAFDDDGKGEWRTSTKTKGINEYLQRVHSQFDPDADIRIMEVPPNE